MVVHVADESVDLWAADLYFSNAIMVLSTKLLIMLLFYDDDSRGDLAFVGAAKERALGNVLHDWVLLRLLLFKSLVDKINNDEK